MTDSDESEPREHGAEENSTADDDPETDPTTENGDEHADIGVDEALRLVREGRTDEIPDRMLDKIRDLADTVRDPGDSEDGESTDSDETTDDAAGATTERLDALESDLAELRAELAGSDRSGDQLADVEAALEEVREAAEANADRIDDLQSEFESYRIRADSEREEVRKYAVEEFATEMIRVKDTLERTLDLLDIDEETQRHLDLVDKQFDQALGEANVEKVETDGKFDIDRHNPVDEVPSPDHEADEIVEARQPGYRIHDRIIRPAEVVVAADSD